MTTLANIEVAIVGIGYVGLPISVGFGKIRYGIGFDINEKRFSGLNSCNDSMLETEPLDQLTATGVQFPSDAAYAGADCCARS